jgi:hypothetical protein
MSHYLKTRRLPLEKTKVSDDVVRGLYAVITPDHPAAFHVSYSSGAAHPVSYLGTVDDLSVKQARQLARAVITMAEVRA